MRTPRFPTRPRRCLAAVTTALALFAVSGPAGGGSAGRPGRPIVLPPPVTADAARRGNVPRLVPVVRATLPHDKRAFTEGLALGPDGDQLVEATGLVGHSDVRIVDPRTGAVRRTAALPALFGEAAAVTRTNGIWQMTWRDHVVVQRDATTLREIRRIPLTGTREGWGLCTETNGQLLQSDGTATLTIRDPATFAPRGHVVVRDGAGELTGLNALDCGRPGQAWANVWPTNRIVRIDTATGRVTADADLAPLRRRAIAADPSLAADPETVPNGIVTIPGSTDVYVTGKLWPLMFRVTLQ
jgi:glutaminyl-peptide cyclotransferase